MADTTVNPTTDADYARILAVNLEDHAVHVRGVIVAQDLRAAAGLLKRYAVQDEAAHRLAAGSAGLVEVLTPILAAWDSGAARPDANVERVKLRRTWPILAQALDRATTWRGIKPAHRA